MKVLYISGSPRKNSNTDYLLRITQSITGGEFIKLSNYKIEPCRSCRICQKTSKCVIDDDMCNFIIPKLIEADAIVIGSPVYFNNVSAQTKAFMDRTWCIRGNSEIKLVVQSLLAEDTAWKVQSPPLTHSSLNMR